jgi:glucokinase
MDHERRVARAAPNVGWEDFPLVDRLAEALEIPFVVDNDVNLAALAHAWRGDARFVRDFVTISIGTGSGAAIVTGGQLLKGSHNAAGEIGHLVLRQDQLHETVASGLGRFEAFVSGPGIATRAQALLAERGGPSMLEGVEMTAEAVLAAAATGDRIGREVVEELLDILAMAMIALVCTVDPELIVLDGAVGRSLAPYLGQLTDRIAPAVPVAPRIVVSRLGRDATVTGAIAAALQLARRHAAPSVLGSIGMAGMAAHVG